MFLSRKEMRIAQQKRDVYCAAEKRCFAEQRCVLRVLLSREEICIAEQ
jgi:hypothetical protein